MKLRINRKLCYRLKSLSHLETQAVMLRYLIMITPNQIYVQIYFRATVAMLRGPYDMPGTEPSSVAYKMSTLQPTYQHSSPATVYFLKAMFIQKYLASTGFAFLESEATSFYSYIQISFLLGSQTHYAQGYFWLLAQRSHLGHPGKYYDVGWV